MKKNILILIAVTSFPILLRAQHRLNNRDFYLDSNIRTITYTFAPDIQLNSYADSLKQLIDCSFKKDILHVMDDDKALLGLHILLTKKYIKKFVVFNVTNVNHFDFSNTLDIPEDIDIINILEYDGIKWKQVFGKERTEYIVSYRQRRLIRRKWKKYFDCNCP
jgi:hypothetical protein